ncbi:Tyrosine recombinase XerC [subsurface metagenome]
MEEQSCGQHILTAHRPLKESAEEIQEQLKLRPRELQVLLRRREEVLEQEGLRRREEILEQLTTVGHKLGQSPKKILEQLRKAWPITIEDAGLQELEQILEPETGTLTIRAGEPSGKPPQSLSSTKELVDKFLAAKRPYIKPVSLKSYELNLRTFARYYPLLPTEPEPIEQYLGRFNNENTGINNIDCVLRLLYQFAAQRLGLPNPMDKIKRPRGKAKPPQHLTIPQALLLLNAIRDDRERALVYCLLGLGLRLSEVRRLRVVDIGEDIIFVHGKERDEPMPLIAEIRDALAKVAANKSPEDSVFSGYKGEPLSDQMIQLIIKRLFSRAGIAGVRPSPHTLRHSRGVITDIAGLDGYSSRRLLRHADTQMTDRYSALNLEELRAKEEQFNPLRVLARRDEQLGKRPYFAQFVSDTIASQDPAQQLPELLDRLIVLGQQAQELKHSLGGNGHWPEQLKELKTILGAPGPK